MLRFLNFYSSQIKQMAVGRRFRIFGLVRGGLAGAEMIHPRVRACDQRRSVCRRSLTPVYPSPEGVPQSWLRKRIDRALRDVDIDDVLPATMRERHQLDRIEGFDRAPASATARCRCARTSTAHRSCVAPLDVRRIARAAARVARGARGTRRPSCACARGGATALSAQSCALSCRLL